MRRPAGLRQARARYAAIKLRALVRVSMTTPPRDTPQGWQPIETAPRDGSRIQLLIPYNPYKFSDADCTDEGYWDAEAVWPYEPRKVGCFRFSGDDGPFDIQPTHWR